jgi:hypothetical protein
MEGVKGVGSPHELMDSEWSPAREPTVKPLDSKRNAPRERGSFGERRRLKPLNDVKLVSSWVPGSAPADFPAFSEPFERWASEPQPSRS